MATDNDRGSPFAPLMAELARMRNKNLKSAIDDVDSVIDLLVSARDQIAQEPDRTSMVMTTLQNPVKARFERITTDLKEVTKAQKGYGKALDKALPHRELPMETDAMADHPGLINRAIAMHLLREGQFSVASTFLKEATDYPPHREALSVPRTDEDGDNDMDDDDDELEDDMGGLHSEHLQSKFSEMYNILSELKNHNLIPAINWANTNSDKLEAKGSTLEFELTKLQYVWLFKGPSVNGLPDDPATNGLCGAVNYGRQQFTRFQSRHLSEIQQLCCAMVYASNLAGSPYKHIFETDSAFEDVAMSFTREFCSLLGLSAESPLYVAVTAGSIALPRLIKYTTYMKEKKTEWTTENELAFETPLPESMIYHPIFVCPVSKEQTTQENPPMMLACGHVICMESLHNIVKAARYKCPYCPTEGQLKDATKIRL